ncbi:uncharacterized protein [Temnothorax nylanderi]|uniref:uncharacterized protein n=1 Tax=Temnothorax nylanderi TaxID=102681 RepID=UPI003A871840
MGGDFNIRIGELGGWEIEEMELERSSKDKVISNGGRNFVEWVQEKGWYILNGTTVGDWDGEYTYVGARGNTVIDYAIVSDNVHERIVKFRIDDKVDSDHMPLILEEEIEKGRGQEVEEESEAREEEEKLVIMWDKDAIQEYKERTEELCMEEGQVCRSVEEKWQRIKQIAQESMVKKWIRIKKKELGHKDWWDRSCTRKKREVHRMYRKWRKGKIGRKRYIEEKGKLRDLQLKKQEEKRQKEEEELRKLKKETDVWKNINKKRNKKVWKKNKIGKKEWRRHFMELLGGSEVEEEEESREKTRHQEGRKEVKRDERIEGDEEDEITEMEIKLALKKLKLKKAAGIDEIPMEAWKYASGPLWNRLVDLLRQIWREGTIPSDWKKSIIVTLYKRGDQEKTGNYRGISLLCTAYKVYAEVIRSRLEKEAEEKGMIPESQAGFRKGRSTIDNIFVLNHLIQKGRRRGGKAEKVYAIFADLKAAFDNVDREILWRILRDKGTNEQLLRRLEMIYEETEVVVRTSQGYTKKFQTSKGVRQGCVISPLLFNLYIAELAEVLKKRDIGGIEVDKMRVWNLEYADDIVMVARNRDALLDMLSTLKRFLKERKLELCTEKTKILVFNRKRKEGKEVWKWGDKYIEEVQSFKYLGFTFNRNGNYKDHIRELMKKGRMAVRKIWGLGERMCRGDFLRRWMLFKYLVQSVMAYGVEIWGWEEKKELEKIMMDYIRWIFAIDFCTPRYVISRELGMDKLMVGWGIRAMKYEERILEDRCGVIVSHCWKEKETYGWKDLYSMERERYYNRNGWGIGFLEEKRREGTNLEEEIISRERDNQRQWEGNKILEARYNKRYRVLDKANGGPEYLKKGNLKKVRIGDDVRALIKLRCGNLEEVNKYWLEENCKKCILCGEGSDCMEHYVKECKRASVWFKDLGRNEAEKWKRLWSDELDLDKGKMLRKLWKEREKELKKRKELNKTKDMTVI